MKRVLSVMIMLSLALAAGTPALAQSPHPLCVGMSDEDCAVLQESLENMRGIGSFNNKEFTVMLGGSGGSSTGNSLTVIGSGPMLVNEEGHITAFHFSVSDSLNEEEAQNGEIIWLEDMIYIGRPNEAGELEWTGTPTDSEGAEFLPDVVSGNLFIKALEQPGVAVARRIEDAELDGQTMLVFVSDVDLVQMLSTPVFLDVLQSLLAAAPEDMTGGDAGGQFGGDLTGAVQLLPMLMTRDTVQVTQWVGADDSLIHHVELKIDLSLDAAMIDPALGEVSFQLEVVSDLDQLGEPVTIEAPTEFDLQETLPLDLGDLDLGALAGGAGDDLGSAEPEPLTAEDRITYGETVSGTLSAENTRDVWGFEAKAGDVVTLVMKAPTPESSLDAQLYLRDAEGKELAYNDDNDGSREGLGVFDALISGVEIPADGEYLIVATWLTETRDGNYELTLEKAE